MEEPAVAKDLSARNEKIVRDFLRAWENKDFDGVVGALSPDIFYHNIPLEPVVGADDMRTFVAGLMGAFHTLEFKGIHLLGAADTVFYERLDCFDFNGDGTTLDLPVAGFFDVDDGGKITSWRDYFDLQFWVDNGGPPL